MPPGSTLAILGGGQLGRMTALAAREMGYGVRVLDPNPDCPASAVADQVVVAGFDDPEAAAELARGAAVVTYEIEAPSSAALRAAARQAPLKPRAAVLDMVRDRAVQKRWLARHGIPLGPWRPAASARELERAVSEMGRARAKVRRGGYDGRAQARVESDEGARRAWRLLGEAPVVVERELSLAAEFSILVARRGAGESVVYPAARNWHLEGILDRSVIPSGLPAAVVARAARHTLSIATRLRLEGLLCVEWFVTRAGEVLLNELAPRPHNTFHATRDACLTNQFEQFVRAICDLPLGAPDLVRPAALANLVGDVLAGEPNAGLRQALALPGVSLHLYGKAPRPGRKIGHLLASAPSPETALRRVREARRRIQFGVGSATAPRRAARLTTRKTRFPGRRSREA